MDDFAAAIEAAARDVGCKGIGTLGEKSLHLALKYYFAPDKASHEQPLGQFVADAVTEEGVIEVQTRGLYRLRRKLDAFLTLCPVTVVHPVAEEKLLVRVDENGAVLSQRKSPKHETVFTAMRELYALRDYVTRPGLCVCLAGVKLTEYSVQAGKSKRVKLDRVPTALTQLWMLASPADYLALLPAMPEQFTAAECAKLLHIPLPDARMLLGLYARLGLAEGEGSRTKTWRLLRPLPADDSTGRRDFHAEQ